MSTILLFLGTPRKSTSSRISDATPEITKQSLDGEQSGTVDETKEVQEKEKGDLEFKGIDLNAKEEANNDESVVKLEKQQEKAKEALEQKKPKERKPAAEFGVSKFLKPKMHAKPKRKTAEMEEKLVKRAKEEKASPKQEKAKISKPKEKSATKKLSVVSSKVTGLPISSVSEGSFPLIPFEHLMNKCKQDACLDGKMITQEVYSSINATVMRNMLIK